MEQRRRLCLFGWWWTGGVAWLVVYGGMWLWSVPCCARHRRYVVRGARRDLMKLLLHRFWRCAYENNRYEREAYRAQYGVAWRLAYRARWEDMTDVPHEIIRMTTLEKIAWVGVTICFLLAVFIVIAIIKALNVSVVRMGCAVLFILSIATGICVHGVINRKVEND